MLNEAIWKSLTGDQSFQEALPEWVRSFLQMSFTEIEALPETAEPQDAETVCRPRLDVFKITTSYLDFLRGQIRVGLRGKRWSDTLQVRLNALIPYEGKELYQLSIHLPKKGHCVVILQIEDLKIVHVES